MADNAKDAPVTVRLDVQVSDSAYGMVRELVRKLYPGRQRMAGVVVEEAIRRLYEAEASKR